MKTIEELYKKAAALCAKKEYAAYDIRLKLEAWESSSEQTQDVIDHLIKERFIDEKRYSSLYVKEKFRFNKWGKGRIRQELLRKRIDKKLIEEALLALPEEEYLYQLVQLLHQKSKAVKGNSEFEIQGKLFRFALGRGFESKLISKALKQLYDEPIELDE